MIKTSLIYIVITFILAFIDYVRIRQQMGKVENINHSISILLAGIGISLAIWIGAFPIFIKEKTSTAFVFIIIVLFSFSLSGIRLLFYDPFLNILRFGIKNWNYESTKTSSYEDQHTTHLSFISKRLIGLGTWIVCFIIYLIVFK